MKQRCGHKENGVMNFHNIVYQNYMASRYIVALKKPDHYTNYIKHSFMAPHQTCRTINWVSFGLPWQLTRQIIYQRFTIWLDKKRQTLCVQVFFRHPSLVATISLYLYWISLWGSETCQILIWNKQFYHRSCNRCEKIGFRKSHFFKRQLKRCFDHDAI